MSNNVCLYNSLFPFKILSYLKMNSPNDDLSTPVRTNLALGTHIRVLVTPTPREGLSKGQGAWCPTLQPGAPSTRGRGNQKPGPPASVWEAPFLLPGLRRRAAPLETPVTSHLSLICEFLTENSIQTSLARTATSLLKHVVSEGLKSSSSQ